PQEPASAHWDKVLYLPRHKVSEEALKTPLRYFPKVDGKALLERRTDKRGYEYCVMTGEGGGRVPCGAVEIPQVKPGSAPEEQKDERTGEEGTDGAGGDAGPGGDGP